MFGQIIQPKEDNAFIEKHEAENSFNFKCT